MAEACLLSSILTFGARVLSTVVLQLRQEALLFRDFRPFLAIVFLPTAVLKHNLEVSWPPPGVSCCLVFCSISRINTLANSRFTVDGKVSNPASGSDVRLLR